ncbi:MAG: hypothetical protein KDD11_01505, partial [Acidobacteria bacterium]|nr:hypothetical protein [Acidobacteriota bacterium]
MARARPVRPPLRRLMGLETEYALRFSGPSHPGNDRLYRAILGAVSSLVHTRPGDGIASKEQVFTENGGAFYYEHLPHAPDGG